MGIELLFAIVFGFGFYSGYKAKEYPTLPKGCEEVIIKNATDNCVQVCRHGNSATRGDRR